MKAIIHANSRTYTIFVDQPIDISIPLRAAKDNVNAWYLPPPKIYPAVIKNWTGSVKSGSSVNFNSIEFNPHAHGTHTECVGHITEEVHSINSCLKQFLFVAEVITVVPEKNGEDLVISEKQLRYAIGNKKREAVVKKISDNAKAMVLDQMENGGVVPQSMDIVRRLSRNKKTTEKVLDLLPFDFGGLDTYDQKMEKILEMEDGYQQLLKIKGLVDTYDDWGSTITNF